MTSKCLILIPRSRAACSGILFQVIGKIARNTLMKVHHILAHHIVPVAGIGEVIGLCARVLASPEERKRMLRNARRVVKAVDNLQASLEVSGFVEQAAFAVTVGILLRRVHIPLAVHHLVILPVDYRPAGHSYLEHVGISEH